MGALAYTKTQIGLHWLIVALVVTQFLTADDMGAFFDKAEKAGVLAGVPTGPVALAHAVCGGAILQLMLLRLSLRIKIGAPAAPVTLAPALRLAARATHYAFYVLLILLPVTGAIALYVNAEAGDVHVVLKTILFALIGLHVIGALTHAFIFKDGVAQRMLP